MTNSQRTAQPAQDAQPSADTQLAQVAAKPAPGKPGPKAAKAPKPAPAPKPEPKAPATYVPAFKKLAREAFAKKDDEVRIFYVPVSGAGGQGPARVKGLAAMAQALGGEVYHDASTRRPDATMTVIVHDAAGVALVALYEQIEYDMEGQGRIARATAAKAGAKSYDVLKSVREALAGFGSTIAEDAKVSVSKARRDEVARFVAALATDGASVEDQADEGATGEGEQAPADAEDAK